MTKRLLVAVVVVGLAYAGVLIGSSVWAGEPPPHAACSTAELAKQGLTGSAIGLHGPHVAFAWLGHATAWPNWTLGCIAVGTRTEVERIVQWVSGNAAHEIIIL